MKRFLMMMTLIGLVGNWNSTLTAQLVSPDSLYLNEDLPEINIVAVKPLIKAEADKTTYSSAGFKVYVNGRPNNMMSKNPRDVLKSMPASSIKKIEVITNPGPKYDAEGA